MKCSDALEKIDAYINDTLSPREQEEFIEHVRKCQECYDELEIHYIISEGMKYLEEEKPGSYNIPQMLKENLRMKENMIRKRKRIAGVLTIVGVVACIVAVAVGLGFLGHLQLPVLF